MAKSKPSFKAKLKPSQKVADFAQYIEQDAKWAEETQQETAHEEREQLPETMPKERKPREKKRIARIQICLTESAKDDVLKIATVMRCKSINDLFCKIADKFIEEHQAEIKQYDSFYGGKING